MKSTNTKYTILVSLVSGAIGAFVVATVFMVAFYSQKDIFFRSISSNLETHVAHTSEDSDTTDSSFKSSQEQQVVDVVEQTSPAVVSIVITQEVPVYEDIYNNPFGDFFPFDFRIPQRQQNGTEKREVGGGSGFLVSADGLVVTNRHVVGQEDAEYTIFTSDGESYEAEVLARDQAFDLAVLKIKGKDFPFVSFDDSSTVKVGQTVIAIGNALAEFKNSVSVGVVSGLSRSITASNGLGQSDLLENVIQTDAAINPGNSGGPLLDLNGKVIGVNVAVAQGSENIGFALPGNLARDAVDSIQKTGKIVRPFIGVRYLQINDRIKELNNLNVDYGALIVRGETPEELAIAPGSPADKAGLEENDIILEANGIKLDGNQSLASIIKSKEVGDTIELLILHDGDQKKVSVKLEEIPA